MDTGDPVEAARYCRTCRRTYRAGVETCPLDLGPLESLPTELPRIGQWVNRRYLVQDRIADGGMGVVFLAHDSHRRYPVALKVLRPSLALQETATQRFFREARAAGRLSHPNVVALFDFGVSLEGWLFLAMERVEGETLALRLARRGRLPVPEALLAAHGIAEALVHAHAHGVVHRDLKPENIVIGSQDPDGGAVKVLDFDIAAIADIPVRGALDRGEVLGTPSYMSPEQVRGDVVDPRSDLYSLGMLIFEMLSGRPPFEGATPVEVMRRQIQDPMPPLPALTLDYGLRKELQGLLLDLTQKDPARRPPDAVVVRDRLRGILNALTLQEVDASEGRILADALAPLRSLIPFHERPTLDLAAVPVPERSSGMGGLGVARIAEVAAPVPVPVPGPRVRLVSLGPVAEWEMPAFHSLPVGRPEEEGPRAREVFATLVHAEFDWADADREAREVFRPEIEAFETAVMADGACLCFDDGRELRLVYGLFDSADNPVEQGIRAARDLERRVARFRRDTGYPVQCRIGVASGPLARHLVRLTAPDQGVRGSRLDVAVRLCRMALPGQTLLDEVSRRHLPPVPAFPEVARLRVRGEPRPSILYRLDPS